MKIITVIILNYKNYTDLKNGLQSLEAQILPADHQLRVIIIDNGSADDSTSRLKA
jgi:GT2 family glycosyltransferase